MSKGRLVKQLLEHRDAILGLVYALTRDLDAAEEVFQNVATAIVEEEARGASVSNFMAWAREMARRRVAEYYRQRARRAAAERPSEGMAEVVCRAFAENEATLDGHRLRLQALVECVKRLTGRGRDMIEGFYTRRLSVRELAAEMGWREDSLRVALSRTRKGLADCVNARLRREGAS